MMAPSEWEIEAMRELIDVLQLLSNGAFESADDYCNRITTGESSIRLLYGSAPSSSRVRLIEWRKQLKAMEDSFTDGTDGHDRV